MDRLCARCETVQPFQRAAGRSNGLQGRCANCAAELQRTWRNANPDRVAASKRRANLRRYGLTQGAFDQMLTAQNGACALCFAVFAPDGQQGPQIDHNHASGKVRSLLCWLCNTALGRHREDSAWFRRAADYLDADS